MLTNARHSTLTTSAARAQTKQLFRRVWGIGSKMADKFYTDGYRTLAELRQALAEKTFKSVRIATGLKHFDDFELRIPRAEVLSL